MAQPEPQTLDTEAIRERVEAATPGPWELVRTSTLYMNGHGVYYVREAGKPGEKLTVSGFQADAEFIAHARDDVPALLAALAEAQRERDEARRVADAARVAIGPEECVADRDCEEYFTGEGRDRPIEFCSHVTFRYATCADAMRAERLMWLVNDVRDLAERHHQGPPSDLAQDVLDSISSWLQSIESELSDLHLPAAVDTYEKNTGGTDGDAV